MRFLTLIARILIMIKSKKELSFYIMADSMMNRGYFKPSLKERIKRFFIKDDIITLLRLMRKCQYYSLSGGVKYAYYLIRYNKLSKKLGMSIGWNSFGYGLVIPHYGTIVVGGSNKCGNYCVLHTSTCITDNGKTIGDALYLSTGAKITSKVSLGDNISVGANSVVNKSFANGNVMIAGAPAIIIKPMDAWYVRDGQSFSERVKNVENLKNRMKL